VFLCNLVAWYNSSVAWGLDYKLYDQETGVSDSWKERQICFFLRALGMTAEFTQPMGTGISFLENKTIGV
jgi:hypothetical protein